MIPKPAELNPGARRDPRSYYMLLLRLLAFFNAYPNVMVFFLTGIKLLDETKTGLPSANSASANNNGYGPSLCSEFTTFRLVSFLTSSRTRNLYPQCPYDNAILALDSGS